MSEKLLYRYLVLVTLSAFFLGTYLLENIGIQYASEGGSPLVKIHIYAYLVIALFLFISLRIGLPRFASAAGEFKRYWRLSLVAVCLVTAYGLYRFGTSGIAYLINTIMVPILAFPMLCMLSQAHQRSLLKLMAWLIIINSSVALLEFLFQRSLIAVEIGSFSHYRSTAFLTHPLNNALVTAALAPVLMSVTRIPTVIYFSIVLLALFAFGGRAAMGIFLLGTFVISFNKIKEFCTTGVRVNRYWAAILPFVFIIVLGCLAYAVMFSPIGDRILSKLFVDRSAEARFNVFILLDQLSLSEWFLGGSKDLLLNIDYFIRINIVENYLVGWIINFGVFGFVCLIIASFYLPFRISGSNLITKVSLICFFIISISNNALTTKTPALFFLYLVLTLYYFNPKKDRNA